MSVSAAPGIPAASPPAVTATPRAAIKVAAIVTLLSVMVMRAALARSTAGFEVTPATAAIRVAKVRAAWIVARSRDTGTTAAATLVSSEPASTSAPAERPRRASRLRSIARARDTSEPTVPGGAAQPSGRLHVRQSLEMAEDHRAAITLGQPPDLLVHGRGVLVTKQAGIRLAADRFHSRHIDLGFLATTTLIRLRPGLARDPGCDAVQPRAQQVRPSDRAGPARQHQEHRLEGIVRRVRVAEQVTA